jgi:hypothetical protein
LKPGALIVAVLPGAIETKVRPAIVIAIASETYLTERPDVIVGILTTKIPSPLASTDYLLVRVGGRELRAQSCFRAFIITLHRSKSRLSDISAMKTGPR